MILLLLHVYPIPRISIYSVFLLSLANIIFLTLSDISRDAFISIGLVKYAGNIILMLSANRFIASIALITMFEKPTLLLWSILYCVATLFTAIFSSVLAFKLTGTPKFKVSRVTQELGQGFAFSVGGAAETIYYDLDKTMLVKLSTPEAAGIYGAAVQVFSVSLTPLQSIMLASYRKFFQQGASGIKSSLKLGRKLFPLALGYSVFAVGAILLFAPFLPKLVGEKYVDSTFALMWLSPLILIRGVNFLAADILTGANYQKARSASQVLVAALNAILNLWLIPPFYWHGAIWATIASELALMLLLGVFIYKYLKERRESKPSGRE